MLVQSTAFLLRPEIPSLAGSAGRIRQFPGLCRREQDSETCWSCQACLSAPPAPRLLTSPPSWLPAATGQNQLQAGFGPGLRATQCEQRRQRETASQRMLWGLQHHRCPPARAWQAGGRPLPHHHLPGCFRASWPIGRSDGHHHPTTAETGTTAHTPGSVFDCNIAVTDFPLPLALAFLLRLSLPFLSSPITSPLPIPVLLPGTGREEGNTRSSAWDLRRGCRAPQTRPQPESLRTSRACRELPASPKPPAPTAPGAAPLPAGRRHRESRSPGPASTNPWHNPCGHIHTDPCVPQQVSPSSLQGRQLPTNMHTRCRHRTVQEPQQLQQSRHFTVHESKEAETSHRPVPPSHS